MHVSVPGMYACTVQLPCRATAGSSTAKADSLVVAEPNLTRIMFEAVDARAASGQAQAGGAGGRTTYQALLAADQAWSNLRNMEVGSWLHAFCCGACSWLADKVLVACSVSLQQADVSMARTDCSVNRMYSIR
jgi:hypothetical protein